MIDGSEKRNRQFAFKLHNSHVCEKRSKISNDVTVINFFSNVINLHLGNSATGYPF